LLECHVNLDLEGFEDRSPEGETTGIKLPYIVTIELESSEVLSIRRNYLPADPKKARVEYFVHFKFLPGLGFYGFGLIHMIGGLSRTATSALRQLLDAGTLANLPAGFKQRGIKIRDDAQSIQPGEFRDVDAPGGNIRDSFMMLPFQGTFTDLIATHGGRSTSGSTFRIDCGLKCWRWESTSGSGYDRGAVGTWITNHVCHS
jgi:hypothetical protein